jgi:hypothetical protein
LYGWAENFQGNVQKRIQGVSATGLPIVWRDRITTEFREGMIAEDWVVTDLAGNLFLARKR